MIKYHVREILKARGITSKQFYEDTGIRITRFKDGNHVYTDVIDKICDYLKVEPCEIMEIIKEDKSYEWQQNNRLND